MACVFGHKWEGDTCARCGKTRGRTTAKAKPCEGEHQWQSTGCMKTCTACGAAEGDHDFQKQGDQYGRSGLSGMYQDYQCGKCNYKVVMRVSDSAGMASLQAGQFMDYASLLGIGPERELNRVLGTPPKEVAFNSALLNK